MGDGKAVLEATSLKEHATYMRCQAIPVVALPAPAPIHSSQDVADRAKKVLSRSGHPVEISAGRTHKLATVIQENKDRSGGKSFFGEMLASDKYTYAEHWE